MNNQSLVNTIHCLVNIVNHIINTLTKIQIKPVQENILLTTNFSNQKLSVTVTVVTNLQNKKLLVTKIVIIMTKKL